MLLRKDCPYGLEWLPGANADGGEILLRQARLPLEAEGLGPECPSILRSRGAWVDFTTAGNYTQPQVDISDGHNGSEGQEGMPLTASC